MTDFPSPPDIDNDVVAQLISYAEACAEWLEADLREARKHSHVASPEQLHNLSGYRFMVLFLEESYDA